MGAGEAPIGAHCYVSAAEAVPLEIALTVNLETEERTAGTTPAKGAAMEDRLSALAAKWRSGGKVDIDQIQRVCDAWRKGKVSVRYADHRMVLQFVDLCGVLVALLWQKSNKSETGALDSKAGFRGICKKGIILLLVWIGVMLDGASGAGVFRTMIVLSFMGNEGLSLLENLGLMGVPFPEALKRALEAMKQKGNQGDGER